MPHSTPRLASALAIALAAAVPTLAAPRLRVETLAEGVHAVESFLGGHELLKPGYETFFRTSLIRNAYDELNPAIAKAAEGGVMTRVTDDVYVYLRKDPTADPVDANVTVIVNEQDVVLVDSNVTLASTRATVRAVRELTSKPVRYVINTHWHNDHVLGNQVYKEAFPQAEFISHPLTRDDIKDRAFGLNEQFKKQLDDLLPKRRAELADSATSSERRAVLQARVPELERMRAELQQMTPTLADITVADQMTLTRGKREIRILFLGRGNTRGDLVVHLPKERVVITGDHVVAPIPWATEVYPSEWMSTLDTLAALPADTIVPGHGPVMHDASHLRFVQGLIRRVMSEAQAAKASGLTLDQATERIQLQDVRDRLTGGDQYKTALFENYFRKPLIKRIWQEQADGSLP